MSKEAVESDISGMVRFYVPKEDQSLVCSDGKVYEYTGKTIIDVKHPETFETAYAMETSFLHRLKGFVGTKYHEYLKNKELDDTLDKMLV